MDQFKKEMDRYIELERKILYVYNNEDMVKFVSNLEILKGREFSTELVFKICGYLKERLSDEKIRNVANVLSDAVMIILSIERNCL